MSFIVEYAAVRPWFSGVRKERRVLAEFAISIEEGLWACRCRRGAALGISEVAFPGSVAIRRRDINHRCIRSKNRSEDGPTKERKGQFHAHIAR